MSVPHKPVKSIVEVVLPQDGPRAIESAPVFPAFSQIVSSHQRCCLRKKLLFSKTKYLCQIFSSNLLSVEAKFSLEEIQHFSSCHVDCWEEKFFRLLGRRWTILSAPLKGCIWQWRTFSFETLFAEM